MFAAKIREYYQDDIFLSKNVQDLVKEIKGLKEDKQAEYKFAIHSIVYSLEMDLVREVCDNLMLSNEETMEELVYVSEKGLSEDKFIYFFEKSNKISSKYLSVIMEELHDSYHLESEIIMPLLLSSEKYEFDKNNIELIEVLLSISEVLKCGIEYFFINNPILIEELHTVALTENYYQKLAISMTNNINKVLLINNITGF